MGLDVSAPNDPGSSGTSRRRFWGAAVWLGTVAACGSSGAAGSPDGSIDQDAEVQVEAAAADGSIGEEAAAAVDAPSDQVSTVQDAGRDGDSAAADEETGGGGCTPPLTANLVSASSGPPSAEASFSTDPSATTCSLVAGPGGSNATLVFDWPGSAGSASLQALSDWHFVSISDGSVQAGGEFASTSSSDQDVTAVITDSAGDTLQITFRISMGRNVTIEQIVHTSADGATDASRE